MQAWVGETLESLRTNTITETHKYNPDGTLNARTLRPLDLTGVQGLTLTNLSVLDPTGTPLATYADQSYGIQIAPGTIGTIAFTVPQGFGMMFCGLYCDADFGASPAYQVKIDTVVRQEIPINTAYDSPYKITYAFDQVAFAKQGAKIVLSISNSGTSTASGTVWPVAFIAAPASQLQMQ